MDLATWRIVYPELSDTLDDAPAQTFLDYAAQSIDAGIFGGSYDQAQGLLAAHYAALSPGGQLARLDPSTITKELTSSTYGLEYKRIRDKVTSMRRVFA